VAAAEEKEQETNRNQPGWLLILRLSVERMRRVRVAAQANHNTPPRTAADSNGTEASTSQPPCITGVSGVFWTDSRL